MSVLHAPQSRGTAKHTGSRKSLVVEEPHSGTRTAAFKGEGCTAPHRILSLRMRRFLEGSKFGLFGLRAGRRTREVLRQFRNPAQRKIWIRQFVLPFRNAILLNRPLVISFAGTPVHLVPHGVVATDLWTGLRCERKEISVILGLLRPDMVVFDIGANEGLFAIGAAKKIGGKKVFAFVACTSTGEILTKNLLLNRLADVNVVQEPLENAKNAGVLHSNTHWKDGLNILSERPHPNKKIVSQDDVRITTIDVFMKDHKVPRVDVMKVDLLGAELMMFRGARDLLERPDAPLILYEGPGFLTRKFGYHPVEILWFLESCGYGLLSLKRETGEISELMPTFQYDSMVIGVKPGHAAFDELRVRLK